MRNHGDANEIEGTLRHGVLKWLSLATSVGMFIVLVMGTLVTNTGSGKGCGGTWPLCHGQFIPQFAVATLIEWSHRAVTGVESMLILALTAGSVALYGRRREIQALAPAMIVFLVLQAVLGMLAANTAEIPAALALHFGVSLLSFATILLTTAFIWELGRGELPRDLPVPRGLYSLIWGSLAYIYVVVYLGAYVRHVSASLACVDWPLCNGAVVPSLSAAVAAQLAHRVAALGAVVLLLVLWLVAYRARAARPDLYRGSLAALVLVCMQAVSGGIIVLTRLDLLSTLLHGALITLLFGCLCYLALHTLPRPAAARVSTRTRALATGR